MRKIKKINLIAIFSAISAILMVIDFPLPIAPTFMKMDISEVPLVIGCFILRPYYAVIMALIKIIIKLFIKPSSTMGMGEIANFISSISFCIPASIIYWKNKTKQNAIIGLIAGTLISSIISVIINASISFPVYIKLFGLSEEQIINMCKVINPMIDDMFKVMIFSVFPFNIIKYAIVSLLTFLLYKHISNLIKNVGN